MEPRRTTRSDDGPRDPRARETAGPAGAGREGDRFADPRQGSGRSGWSAFEPAEEPRGRERGRTGPPPRPGRLDLSPLFVLLDALRRAVPSDLQAQFTALLREALLTLRSLIDWYLERLDRPPREPRVEDIPIE
jgi:hypothetical protein